MRRKYTVLLWVGMILVGLGGLCSAQQTKPDGTVTGPAAQQAQGPAQNDPVAKVNGSMISKSQLDQEMAGIQRRMARQGQVMPDGALDKIRGKVLDQMIGQELLLQESRKQKIQIDEKAIQAQIEEMAKSFDDKAAFDVALSAGGLSRETLSERLRHQAAIRQLVDDKIVAGLKVADSDADAFYKAHPEIFLQPEQVKARHILIRVGDQADSQAKEAARKQIEEIRKQVAGGGDFAALAKTYSQDPGSKENGGDLGFFGRGQMVKPFEEAAFALAPKEISPVVETQFGFHLIQVTERKAAEAVAYDQAKPKILEHLKQQAIHEKLDAYVQNLRQEAKIEKFI